MFERVTVEFSIPEENGKEMDVVNIAQVAQSAKTIIDRQKLSLAPIKDRLKTDELVAKYETSARSETQETAPTQQVQPVEPVQPSAAVTANASGLGQRVDMAV
ncbi:MAG: hypothetical protein ISR47_04460 [Rhodospirillales bacterium]|nr:hypothetical protein [Rhodospirillales bacterium]